LAHRKLGELFFKRKRDQGNINRREIEIEKGKKETFSPSIGPNPAQPCPSLPRVVFPPPGSRDPSPARPLALASRLPSRCQPDPTHQSRTSFLPRDRPLSGRQAPPVISLSLSVARDRLSTRSPPATTPPCLLVITPMPVKLGTAPPPQFTVLAPLHGSLPVRSRPRRCAPSSPPRCPSLAPAGLWPLPPRAPIKRTAQAPPFFTPASTTSLPLPRVQTSQLRRRLPLR
jgi:hypothetical protein